MRWIRAIGLGLFVLSVEILIVFVAHSLNILYSLTVLIGLAVIFGLLCAGAGVYLLRWQEREFLEKKTKG